MRRFQALPKGIAGGYSALAPAPSRPSPGPRGGCSTIPIDVDGLAKVASAEGWSEKP